MIKLRKIAGAAALLALLPWTPAALGTAAIANWDVVPEQVLTEPLQLGVVAFHETGVDVKFTINGEDAGTVTDPVMNEQTKVVEYWITLDPAKYPDGPLTVGATATPEGQGHEARELPEITFYANTKGTLPLGKTVWVDAAAGSDDTGTGTEDAPFMSIAAGVKAAGEGGTVYLKKSSDYRLTVLGDGKAQYWTTVSAAPGLTAEDVQILTYGPDDTSTGRYGGNMIRWHNVSLYCERPEERFGSIFYLNAGQKLWFDGAVLYDRKGRFANSVPFNGKGAKTYLTDSTIRDLSNSGGSFKRNVLIENICSDIFRGSSNLTAINVTINKIDRGETEAHPDFLQIYNPKSTVENIILYNVRAYDMGAQGIFGAAGEVKDIAMINLVLEKMPPESYLLSQLTGQWTHGLLWNTTIVNQTFFFRDSSNIRDFDVRNCVFAQLTTDNPEHDSIKIQAAHTSGLSHSQSEPLGENSTLGDPLYVDKEGKDFRLQSGSPAYGTGITIPGVPADIDGVLYDTEAPNRGAFAKKNPGKQAK